MLSVSFLTNGGRRVWR
jgi:hypothetical protein